MAGREGGGREAGREGGGGGVGNDGRRVLTSSYLSSANRN